MLTTPPRRPRRRPLLDLAIGFTVIVAFWVSVAIWPIGVAMALWSLLLIVALTVYVPKSLEEPADNDPAERTRGGAR